MKSPLSLILSAIVFATLVACQEDNIAEPKPESAVGVSNLQFEIINNDATPSDETVEITLHIIKQSLMDDSKVVLLDSTFTVNLAEISEPLRITKSIQIDDVNKETVVSCASIKRSDGRNMTSCGYADQKGRVERYELYTTW